MKGSINLRTAIGFIYVISFENSSLLGLWKAGERKEGFLS